MRRAIALLVLASLASAAEAQVRRKVPTLREPAAWGSLSLGLFNANDVSDGATGSTWDFGRASNPQFRASLEKSISNTASIGATGTYVHLPFTYVGTGASASCTRCASHLDVVSFAASFHVGGGIGLHQVLEASAGVMQYRNLRRDDGGRDLEPTRGNIDPYFTFGYGFGYAFNPALHVSVVQDLGLGLHERSGLTSEQSNTLRQRTIRVNLRYGFGDRSRRK
ncbi:MAG TPA: hypothetical protein VHM24_04750 [Gemmatimonadaceae bacterium]|nr:hypothetical protein [Gemmatimonadaceae bacterium]